MSESDECHVMRPYPYVIDNRESPLDPPLEWCERCQSWHTSEFGKEFHDRVLQQRFAGLDWLDK